MGRPLRIAVSYSVEMKVIRPSKQALVFQICHPVVTIIQATALGGLVQSSHNLLQVVMLVVSGGSNSREFYMASSAMHYQVLNIFPIVYSLLYYG